MECRYYIHSYRKRWMDLSCISRRFIFTKNNWLGIWEKYGCRTCKKSIRKCKTKNTEGIILQTDLGSQYTSNIFEEYLAELKIRHSYSRKGCPYDNSYIESFHSILKKEEVNLKKYKDFKEAYNAIFEFIEAWYNRERIHSCLNYKTPDEVHSEDEESFAA